MAQSFPIVGIGASAGGIEALEGFFKGLPDLPGLAVVIVTHLNPERESLLHEIVARYTKMPVQIAVDGTEVLVDTVHVLAADATLGIANGRLTVRRPSRHERKPIDIFFSALAVDQGELAVGIVLSGGDSDGTLGIKAIKEHGGLTFAQVADGFGPGHPNMPESAIATGLVDLAIKADAMGSRLVEFTRGLHTLADLADEESEERQHDEIEAVRRDICTLLRNQVGHDFSGYKKKTFIRRVQRRMQVRQTTTLAAYVEQLQGEPAEVAALFRDLLVNVTNFFRDPEAFQVLAEQVIPRLFEDRGADDVIRVWIPGCATGEEVFSLAILLREHMDRLIVEPRVQLFATDIDERALAVARSARYPETMLEGVSPERRRRFFTADGGGCTVVKEIRELCVFSAHSVIRDPPFSRMDLVSCRNLLIYLGLDMQRQVIPTFHYALRPTGYLFLGLSENVGQFGDLFMPVDKKQRIFRRRSDVAASIKLPMMVGSLRPGPSGETRERRAQLGGGTLRQVAEDQVLERFAPPHVVVNRDGEIVHYSARTGKYLEAAPGTPTRQIFTMARRGLRHDLRHAFAEVTESSQAVVRERIVVEGDDGHVQPINLVVEPLSGRSNGEPLFLILFIDQGPQLSRAEAFGQRDAVAPSVDPDTERELRDTRERLQAMVEEYETAIEELKSSNEELVSVNEEAQSTNEELEASKEELVSVNEELHTVNNELTGKVDAYDRAITDLQNLFDNTQIALVFLDTSLVIRSFTPAMQAIFNIRAGDTGRPITDLSSRFTLPELKDEIATVFAEDRMIERRIEQAGEAAQYLMRLVPYRDAEQQVAGVVLTFVDISSLVEAERGQAVLIAELQHRTRNLLAVVRSIAGRSLEPSPGLEEYDARLAALGRVQGFLSRSPDFQVPLAELVRAEMAAAGAGASEKVTIDGPGVALPSESVQAVALVLHELATNALKYGALVHETGRLAVSWRIEADDGADQRLVIDWQESGVAMPAGPPARRGYGSELITRSLRHQLDAQTELRFTPEGVRCRIALPASAFKDGREEQA